MDKLLKSIAETLTNELLVDHYTEAIKLEHLNEFVKLYVKVLREEIMKRIVGTPYEQKNI